MRWLGLSCIVYDMTFFSVFRYRFRCPCICICNIYIVAFSVHFSFHYPYRYAGIYIYIPIYTNIPGYTRIYRIYHEDIEFFLPGTNISTNPSSSPSLLSFCPSSSPYGDPAYSLNRFAPRLGYPSDSLMIASSSSSESAAIIDVPTEGPTISPISSSSSSSPPAAWLPRCWFCCCCCSSGELAENEPGGLNRVSGKVGEKGSSLNSDGGNPDSWSSVFPSSSRPAITNGFCALELPSVCSSSLSSSSSSSSSSSFSSLVACCFCAASRAASCRRARDGPRLRGAGGGGRIGIGWLVELADSYSCVVSSRPLLS